MTGEENKAIMHRFFEELFNRGDFEAANEIVAEDYLNHDALPGQAPGREGLKDFITTLRTAFPDIHFTVEDQIAEGDKVVTRFTATGTHQGEFIGIPATGRHVTVTAINIHRVREGKLEEAWLNWDALGMMQQLGVAPPPG